MAYKEERNPFFEVKKEDVFTASGVKIPNKVALVNADLESVVGFVSPGYDIVENQAVTNLFEEATSEFGVSTVKDHMDATTKRWRRQFIFNDDRLNAEILPSDIVGVMLEVYNGYDGRTAFGYSLMGYRWMCENGMIMGKRNLFSESFAHYDGNVEKLRESFAFKFNMFHKNAKVWEKWSKEPFNQESFDNYLKAHTKPVNAKAKSHEYLSPKMASGIGDSYVPILSNQKLEENKWGAFNVLTYLMTHETKARNGSNVFSNRYNMMGRLAGDMYNEEENKMLITV